LIDQKLGDAQYALVNFRNALEIKREIDDGAGEASIWNRIGAIHKDQEDYDVAATCFKKALEIFLEIGDVNGIGSTFGQLGIMASRRGHAEEGLRLVILGAMILGPIESDNFEIGGILGQLPGFRAKLQPGAVRRYQPGISRSLPKGQWMVPDRCRLRRPRART
jgi:tetratricopeptide (TPR) repeat protein